MLCRIMLNKLNISSIDSWKKTLLRVTFQCQFANAFLLLYWQLFLFLHFDFLFFCLMSVNTFKECEWLLATPEQLERVLSVFQYDWQKNVQCEMIEQQRNKNVIVLICFDLLNIINIWSGNCNVSTSLSLSVYLLISV